MSKVFKDTVLSSSTVSNYEKAEISVASLNGAFAQMVEDLVKDGEEIRLSLTAKKCDLLHMAVGVAGEASELTEAVYIADIKNVIEECGDIEFYMQRLNVLTGGLLLREEKADARVDALTCVNIEAGQVLDVVKKHVIYNKESAFDLIAPALQKLANALDQFYGCTYATKQQAMEHCLNKLLKGENARYAAGTYSDEAAATRSDKD